MTEASTLHPTLASPLINAYHPDISQPWSGVAGLMIELQPNPDLGPVTFEIGLKETNVTLTKEVTKTELSKLRVNLQTDLLPDGPGVLVLIAKQDKFIWEASLPFRVSNNAGGAATVLQNLQTGTPILFEPPDTEGASPTSERAVLSSATSTLTIFRYACACGAIETFARGDGFVQCCHCAAKYRASATIDFFGKKTEQNAYFDAAYEAGILQKRDDLSISPARSYESTYDKAQRYLAWCGLDPALPVADLAILDVACGSGWVTAGLMRNPMVQRCSFHACDISPQGLEMLAKYLETVESTNSVEMSVQDANQMVFQDGTFDLVFGSSVLHHFSDVPAFLSKCRRILKPGGKAVFGEPFAFGYGLALGALMVAQRQLGVQYDGIAAAYKDIAYRVQHPDQVENLVDKHLFFHSSFLSMALSAGFSDVTFTSPAPRWFYRDRFIGQLMAERGVSDPDLLARANEIYSAFFEVFDAESYGESVAAYVQVVLQA